MSYQAEVLADSISPDGVRLTTICATYPRIIHSELMTHRVFGRNAASSRAIPPEKNIERVQNQPFVPDFYKRSKGMGHGPPLNEHDAVLATTAWLTARDKVVQNCLVLLDLDVDKASINRLLEPFSWITTIITATEWSNFLALRQPSNDDPVPQLDFPARAEFQIIARIMRDAMRDSTPVELSKHDWHLPLVAPEELAENDPGWTQREWARVSAGRCARVSFDTHGRYEEPEASIKRFARLSGSAHWCYDDATEVLTRDGWKAWPDVHGDESFLTRDASGSLSYERAKAVVHQPYKGEMVCVEHNAVDLLVTPEHNMFGSIRWHDGWSEPVLVPARKMMERALRMQSGAGWCDASMDDRARLIGFFIGDGCAIGHRVRFHLRRSRKIAYLRDLCLKLRIELREMAADSYVLIVGDDLLAVFRSCYTPDRKKQIPWGAIQTCSARSGLLDGLMQSDGSTDDRGRRIYTTSSPVLANHVQSLCALLGGSASKRGPDGEGRYRLGITAERQLRPRVGWTRQLRRDQVGSVPYDGYVHCVSVPSGVLLVRRNGKPIWSGNSAMEHSARPMRCMSDMIDPVLRDKIFGVPRPGPMLPESYELFCGHLRGWVCLRKLYENEHDRSLVIAERPEVERQ